ncbi:hypothetical protein Sarmat_00822 [Rickettsiales endosymbiont of Paramecium tredecaurelia]|uniref:hypothetical protein n=1 Tax=Candidatus Sarmatiella mevalonica TaxID=2770581 RepID=UPI00192052F7|nr:hypothetical protein [Candidatus Sarmatiella mevalonica]MBL3284962.1 hypothetical protein [Candidatus Sarmatiella mevalonica]
MQIKQVKGLSNHNIYIDLAPPLSVQLENAIAAQNLEQCNVIIRKYQARAQELPQNKIKELKNLCLQLQEYEEYRENAQYPLDILECYVALKEGLLAYRFIQSEFAPAPDMHTREQVVIALLEKAIALNFDVENALLMIVEKDWRSAVPHFPLVLQNDEVLGFDQRLIHIAYNEKEYTHFSAVDSIKYVSFVRQYLTVAKFALDNKQYKRGMAHMLALSQEDNFKDLWDGKFVKLFKNPLAKVKAVAERNEEIQKYHEAFGALKEFYCATSGAFGARDAEILEKAQEYYLELEQLPPETCLQALEELEWIMSRK